MSKHGKPATPQLAFYPLNDGDYGLAYWSEGGQCWLFVKPFFMGMVDPEIYDDLIPLHPNPVDLENATETLVAKFRAQLDATE